MPQVSESQKQCMLRYYQKNRARILEYKNRRVKCEACACEIQVSNLSHHVKTKKHIINKLIYSGDTT